MASSNTTNLPPYVHYKSDPNNPYNFVPTLWVCATYVALYSLSTLLHVIQGTLHRTWFMLPTAVLAGTLEILGWSGRLWSSKNVDLKNPFMIQITGCIIGPTPLLAADFVIFGVITQRLGERYSRLVAKWYTIIFVSCDIISLVVQAVGGAMASEASDRNDFIGARRGGHIMLGGIAFQLCVIVFFALFATEFLYRYFSERPVREKSRDVRGPLTYELKLMLGALIFDITCLFIRAVYRTIELADGWNGRIISTQLYFNVLDGMMVTMAMFALNFFHPGRLLMRPTSNKVDPEQKSSGSLGSEGL